MRKQPFASPEEALKHHGVKGMKWGVRKEDERSGDRSSSNKETVNINSITKGYMAAARIESDRPKTKSELTTWVTEQKKDFGAKFDPKGVDPTTVVSEKGITLTDQQKKLLIGGAAVVGVVGGLYLYNRYSTDPGRIYRNFDPSKVSPGQKVDGDTYRMMVNKTWGSGQPHVTDASFLRPEFELPAGHKFYRLSTRNEAHWGISSAFSDEIGHGTYATASIDDFNRYVAGFRGEKGKAGEIGRIHKVEFTSKVPIKVPTMTTVLETLRETMEKETPNATFSQEEVLKRYRGMSGKSWTMPREISLLDALKAKGYGAIIDDMDAGVIGEKPLVVFGGDSKFTGKISSLMTNKEVQAAESAITEIPRRKYSPKPKPNASKTPVAKLKTLVPT